MEQYDAFVSYSHADEEFVKPVVNLLRVGGRRIFWDATEIVPGVLWADRIADAIANSSVVIVLWCCHAAQSVFVSDEIAHATRGEKGLVPVLLCSFPVTSSMARYQWVDFSVIKHTCEGHAARAVSDGNGVDVVTFLRQAGALTSADFATEYFEYFWGERPIERLPTLIRRQVGTLLGVIVTALAILRPFASTLEIAEVVAINTLVALIGLFLLAYNSKTLRRILHRGHPRLPAADYTVSASPEQVLALVIEAAVRQSQHIKARVSRA